MNVYGKKIVLVGMGRTALSLVRLLLREGAFPFVTDSGSSDDLNAYCAELDALGVPYECGGHSQDAFADAAAVIPSPGVPPTIAPIVQARAAGAAIMGEMEFASAYASSPILAVTGTNGKTTTTELLKTLVGACGHSVLLAGNNDVPLSQAVQTDPSPAYFVVEVSSYQLETSHTFRPWIGAVLNVTPDHLARHETMEMYAAVKARLFANQRPGDFAVLNDDDERVRAMASWLHADVRSFSMARRIENGLWLDGDAIREGDEAAALVSDTMLLGKHNIENVLAALTIMRAGGFNWDRTLDGLRGFQGVEHRIEHVITANDVAYYNDSKSTNIASLEVALKSFETPIVLIAGGRGKGADYRVLRDLVVDRVKMLVVLGEDAPLLEAAFGDLVQIGHARDMDDAVASATEAAAPGDIVLLSPGCASFDMYADFEHRGRVFKECLCRYLGGLCSKQGDAP